MQKSCIPLKITIKRTEVFDRNNRNTELHIKFHTKVVLRPRSSSPDGLCVCEGRGCLRHSLFHTNDFKPTPQNPPPNFYS